MELSKEVIEAQGFSAEQVTAINGFGLDHTNNIVADTKKAYDGKANEQAEGILTGAAKRITDITKVERNQGEKVADFMTRAYGVMSETGNTELAAAKLEYDEKVKNFKGDPDQAKRLEEAREKLDGLQKKEADYDALINGDFEGKYNTLKGEQDALNKEIAFGKVKPNFSEDSNAYEVSAKWGEFQSEVLGKYNIVLVDGEAIAIDKDNEHKTIKLKDLVSQNEVLTELAKGRQQQPLNGKQTDLKDVEGLPFKLDVNADLTKQIQEHLAANGVGKLDSAYSKKFGELYKTAKAATQKNV
jgi:hypothetical protein